jgi:hypothetical protein
MMQPGETMKIDKRIRAFLPSLKAVGAALAFACTGQASIAGVVTANLGGYGHASAVVPEGTVINFLDRSQTYSTFATNGLVTDSSTLASPDWDSAAALSQALPRELRRWVKRCLSRARRTSIAWRRHGDSCPG